MLKVPKLDDLSYEQIIQRAVSRVPAMTDEWTDFNSHDPGITVLQTYAWLTDMFKRIKDSDEKDEKVVMILPNPAGIYRRVAYLLNKCNVSARNLVVFTQDEWADQDGRIAPPEYPAGFTNAFMRFFWNELKPELRPRWENIHFPTNENINDYSKMIEDAGEGDVIYSACGWSGHASFWPAGSSR